MRVLIVGAGIGGLCAATALARAGHPLTLVERAEALAPIGAGIVMAPNAAHALTWLGVDLAADGLAIQGFDIVGASGQIIQRFGDGALAERFGPTWTFARPELHDALVRALPSAVDFRLGTPVSNFSAGRDGVEVELGGRTETFDLLVGADGLRSGIRETLLGPTRYRYSGVSCYRGIVLNPGFDRATEAWGDRSRVGVVPLSRDRLYYYFVHSVPERAGPLADIPALRRAFGGFSGGVERVVLALDMLPPLHHDLVELDAPAWGRGRVLLLGDAAHGMTPNQGQGAAMAVEDALALAMSVRAGPDAALAAYSAARHERVRQMQLDSRRLGQVAHLSGRAVQWARDGLMRLTPASMGVSQYRRVVDPGLALLERTRVEFHAPAGA